MSRAPRRPPIPWSALVLLLCAAADAVLASRLRELMPPSRLYGQLLLLIPGPAVGIAAVYLTAAVSYGLSNLLSARRRRTGLPVSWNRVFPAVCRAYVAAGPVPLLLLMAGLWVLPASAAGRLAPCLVLMAPVPLVADLLLCRLPQPAWMPGPACNEKEESSMRFVVATHNEKKLRELSRILSALEIEAVTGEQLGLALTEPEETGSTFEENAWIKASSACRETGLPAVADDSGLMVDALDGAPGVYSARYAGEGATDADRNRKLLRELEGVPEEKRTARFVSVICCVFPDGTSLTARGECPGRIAFVPRGEDGFGYDPLFVVAGGLPGAGKTYSELTGGEKDAVSHRGNALRVFSDRLRDRLADRPSRT